MWAKLLDTVFHRSLSFLIAAMFLLVLALWGAPQLLEVTVYKLGLVFASASAGYWIDRVTFPYARPDQVAENELSLDRVPNYKDETHVRSAAHDYITLGAMLMSQSMIRRAIIMAACMICVGLGA